MVIDVDFYELQDGSAPVKDFLDGLEIKLRAKMYREIDLLVMNGPELREPHSKHVMVLKLEFVPETEAVK